MRKKWLYAKKTKLHLKGEVSSPPKEKNVKQPSNGGISDRKLIPDFALLYFAHIIVDLDI